MPLSLFGYDKKRELIMSNAVADPTTPKEIEAFLKAKVESGEAGTGLYDVGLHYVVVRRSNDVGEPIYFDWFEHPIQISDLLKD